MSSQNAYVNINRIMSVASRLAEAGHYASTQIKQISGQLDQDWKSFAAALDERSTILAMSSVFHQKAEQVGIGLSWHRGKDFSLCQSFCFSFGWKDDYCFLKFFF